MQMQKKQTEWLIGKHYIYNPDQDKSRDEIQNLIDNGEFVKDDDYDDDGYNTIPFERRYKQYSNRTNSFGYANNVSGNKTVKQIEVSDDINVFKKEDRFQTIDQNEDVSPYIIVAIDPNTNSNRMKATYLYPNNYSAYTSRTILTLE